jgi:tripartite-type tricarboxylate transporter receptor subunit TctC
MLTKIKTLLVTAFLGIGFASHAVETIVIESPYSPSHSATPATLRIIKEANSLQNEFEFILEYRPGGQQVIAVKQMDAGPQNRLAIIAPAFVENTLIGKLNRADYVPVHALGDACWAVISNRGNEAGGIASLRGEREIIVGGVGIGNASHLTGLLAGERYGFRVKYIVFKSNNEALVNMAGNNGVNFVIDQIESYATFKTQNPNLQVLAASCPKRLAGMPNIKTLKEQGIDAPYIFNITIANVAMPAAKRKHISKILDDATAKVGEAEINKLSGLRPPMFDKISTDQFYANSIQVMETLSSKFNTQIGDKPRQ